MRRSQVSMEYLAVYGFAVALVLGMIGTFSYLNSNPMQRVPNDCRFSPGIDCKDFEIISGGDSTLILKNNKEKLYEVSLICKFSDDQTKSIIPIPIINKGEEFTIICPTAASINSGKKTKIEAKLEYHLNISSTKNWRHYDGTIIGKVR